MGIQNNRFFNNMAVSVGPLKLYKQILRILPRTFANDFEMQMTGRTKLREYYETRRSETDPGKIKEYLDEAQGVVTVLTQELMQVEITETDKYGNPSKGVAQIRPEMLRDPPTSN